MNSVLTLDFGTTGIAGKPPHALAGGGFQLGKMRQGTNDNIMYLRLKNFKFNTQWYNFRMTELKRTRSKMCWYSCRIGMDPSILGYQNTVEYQSPLIYKLIDEFSSEIKYLALVYEWGDNLKLHWHFLICFTGIRDFRKTACKIFGKKHAVFCKKVEPNNGETFTENLQRIVQYYKKEEHNKEGCYLTKNV